jgi:hypothetical protein
MEHDGCLPRLQHAATCANLRHMNPVRMIPLYYFRFTFTLSSHLRPGFKVASFFVGPRPNVCIDVLYNTLSIPCPVMKLLIM